MPKESGTQSSVFGHAPRKALVVKKAIKKGSGKKGASNAKPPKKAAPAALEVVSADEHVSASPTPPTPRSPRSPRSPSYVRESWWDSFGDLSRRIDETAAAVKDLKEYVKRLEEEGEKNRAAGSVFGKRD
jgi:outer membrane protein TolC